MENFTPWTSLIGGVLIGISASLLMWLNGRIAGISGILAGGAGLSEPGERSWRLLFLFGLFLGSALILYLVPGQPAFIPRSMYSPDLLVIGGVLVGFGSRMGSGCTSGHGICGIARLSTRSILAVLAFMFSGAVTVYVARHVFGAF